MSELEPNSHLLEPDTREFRTCPYYDSRRHYCKCNDYEVVELQAKVDELQAALEAKEQLERDSAYMRLPVDADGVPIHVGDLLETSEYNGQRFHCSGFCYDTAIAKARWTIAMSYDNETGTTEFVSARSCRHVQPDTVESVLEKLYGELRGKYIIDSDWLKDYENNIEDLMGYEIEYEPHTNPTPPLILADDMIAKYAERIRKVVE